VNESSVLVITSFRDGRRIFHLAPPLELEIEDCGDDGLLVRDDDLDVCCWNYSRANLETEVQYWLRLTWNTYVDCSEDKLTPAALGLRRRLQKRVVMEIVT
jgi:hypothetical protein